MSILVNGSTKVICQGITGSAGAFHTKGCLDYGTRMVGGVTPNKGGQKDANGLPIFNTVAEALQETGANASMIFVPPPFAADSILEAADAGVQVICAITEGIPIADMMRVRAMLAGYPDTVLIGPNCPGIIRQAARFLAKVHTLCTKKVAKLALCLATFTQPLATPLLERALVL